MHTPIELQALCKDLREAALQLESVGAELPWPQRQMRWLAEAGVFGWFVPAPFGVGFRSEAEQLEGYLAISQACMTTAFVLTQWNAACKRIASSSNEAARQRWLPGLARGELFATVGISHLTTSRQHVRQPVLRATPDQRGGFVLSGFSPWVTGASKADVLVVGASLPEDGSHHAGQQILCAIPGDRKGLTPGAGARLMALSASQTDVVQFDEVRVDIQEVLAGPIPNVMQAGAGGGAGGLQTSTLAIGLTFAAIEFLHREAGARPELNRIADKLHADASRLREWLLALAQEQPLVGLAAPIPADRTPADRTPAKLREQANSLVLRSTQAALAAAKGAGFVAEHPAGRWCREALFFLVWSCPQPVLSANLCEFAQV